MLRKYSKFGPRLIIIKTFYERVCCVYILGDSDRKKKRAIKRKEDGHAAKDRLKGPLRILASVWENKRVDVNVDNFKI